MKDPQKSRFSYKKYVGIGFAIMMQLFGNKVEYAESSITKDDGDCP